MIIGLEFKDFVQRFDKELTIGNGLIHYTEDERLFQLFFKGESFVYKTVVLKEEIISFGSVNGLDREVSMDDFRGTYLHSATYFSYSDSPKLFPEETESFEVQGLLENKDYTDYLVKKVDEEMVEESDSYEEFLSKTIKGWEKGVLKAIEELDKEQFLNKKGNTLGQFLSSLFNTVNSASFMKGIRVQLKRIMSAGVDSAEKELDIDIGFGEHFNAALNLSVQEELNGYKVQGDGAAWKGIKGATKKIQFNILNTVEEGFIKGDSQAEVTKKVQEIFTKASKGQAERIARTETTRLFNRSKLASYKDAGVKFKWWDAVHDNKTSEICNRLGNKYDRDGVIPIDELFIDDVTGKSFEHPPSHVSCRSVVRSKRQ